VRIASFCAHAWIAVSGSHVGRVVGFEEHRMKSGSKLFLFAGIGLALVAVLLGVTMSSGDKTADAKSV